MADFIVDGASAEDIEVYYKGKFRKSALIEGAYEAEDYFPAVGNGGKWLHFTASPVVGDDGQMIGAIETFIDITERKDLEDNLRYYSQQINRAQEEERKRIARELHDDMAQILGSLSRQLDNLLRKANSFNKDEVSTLKEVQNQLNRGLQFVQHFIQNLRPSLLDDLGLIPALRSLTNGLEQTEGIAASFTMIGEKRTLTPEVRLSLFRIVQEALNNIKKHAEASKVQVTVNFAANKVKLAVSDNGRGFELPESMANLPRKGKLGLMGIEERVCLLGGTLEINSKPGEGTTLLVEVPA